MSTAWVETLIGKSYHRMREVQIFLAETVVADRFDLDQLLAAMRGTRRTYYLPFYHNYMIQSATAFAVAAKEVKLEAIVSMGQWLAGPIHPSLATRMLTPEPTGGVVWNANRGAVTLRVIVSGKSAHVGRQFEGVNAFERALPSGQAGVRYP